MRLFIAAELPETLLEALAESSAALRSCVRGRYVAPDSFHVTLVFLGDVEAGRVSLAADALEEGCRDEEAFEASLGEFGCFGRRAKATLWQGFTDAGALPKLAQSIRAQLKDAGFSFDDKAFLPHVTLMRSADLTIGKLPSLALASARIDTVTLFRSDLSGKRPVYEPLHSVRLATR